MAFQIQKSVSIWQKSIRSCRLLVLTLEHLLRLSICISNQLPGDAAAAGSGTSLGDNCSRQFEKVETQPVCESNSSGWQHSRCWGEGRIGKSEYLTSGGQPRSRLQQCIRKHHCQLGLQEGAGEEGCTVLTRTTWRVREGRFHVLHLEERCQAQNKCSVIICCTNECTDRRMS